MFLDSMHNARSDGFSWWKKISLLIQVGTARDLKGMIRNGKVLSIMYGFTPFLIVMGPLYYWLGTIFSSSIDLLTLLTFLIGFLYFSFVFELIPYVRSLRLLERLQRTLDNSLRDVEVSKGCTDDVKLVSGIVKTSVLTKMLNDLIAEHEDLTRTIQGYRQFPPIFDIHDCVGERLKNVNEAMSNIIRKRHSFLRWLDWYQAVKERVDALSLILLVLPREEVEYPEDWKKEVLIFLEKFSAHQNFVFFPAHSDDWVPEIPEGLKVETARRMLERLHEHMREYIRQSRSYSE